MLASPKKWTGHMCHDIVIIHGFCKIVLVLDICKAEMQSKLHVF